MFIVDWTQHAVGHGGFHSGRAQVSGNLQFNWIFDCGARKSSIFDTFLCDWTKKNQQPVDWLFISHFDTDHVSGLNTLLSRADVRDVMVPYVNDSELAIQLLHDINKGNLDRPLFELVADPASFFLGRGAARVTFLGGGRPRGEPIEGSTPDSPRDGTPDSPRDGDHWICKINPPPTPLTAPRMFGITRGEKNRVQVVKNDCVMVVSNGSVGLRLKPYRAPSNFRTRLGLINKLQALVGDTLRKRGRPGLGSLAFAIGNYARHPTGRSALRDLYKTYTGSSNRSSLSLLSVPYIASKIEAFWRVSSAATWSSGYGPAGWLNTGDAELLRTADLQDWKDAYTSDLHSVRVLALPHHGSDKNSNNALQQLCPEAVLAAHVKVGAKKHPGPNVTAFAGDRLALVTDHPCTNMRMHFRTLGLE